MEWSTILEILKWLIPAGSVGSIVVWYANRTTRELKNIKDSHDAYKLMYDDVKQTLQDEIEEKRALRKALGKFERAMAKVFGCRYYPQCPVNFELQHQQTGDAKPKGNQRQRGNKRNTGSAAGDSTGITDGTGDPDDKPP